MLEVGIKSDDLPFPILMHFIYCGKFIDHILHFFLVIIVIESWE